MEASFAELLSQVYELEGLLLVMEKRGDETPQLLRDAIKEKAASIARLAATVGQDEPADEPPAAPRAGLPSDDYDPDETWQHDNGEEPAEIFTSPVQPEAEEGDAQPQAEDAPEPPADEDEEEQQPADEDDEEQPEDEDEEDEDEQPDDDDDEDADPDEDLRVDEKLQRSLYKNLRKALPLNDRYRFRRELFANSELDMNDALSMVDSMKSYDEATDYFYNELGWNPDDENVADFMNIVKKHFL